jgi:hypothetical protein
VFDAFQRIFAERGLPAAIRSDNGLPFASPNGLYNLSKLSVWWLRLGNGRERIRPGYPQENGRLARWIAVGKSRLRSVVRGTLLAFKTIYAFLKKAMSGIGDAKLP